MDTLHQWAGKVYYGNELHLEDINGKVERIGIKSTHLRSMDGEQRTTYVLNLAFDTLRTIPALIEQVVKSLPGARFGRCTLRGLGSAGFEYEVSFFATDPGNVPVAELRAQFTLALLEKLRSQGIGFAAPGAPVFGRQPPPFAPAAPAAPATPTAKSPQPEVA
jgi:hypothetical protein